VIRRLDTAFTKIVVTIQMSILGQRGFGVFAAAPSAAANTPTLSSNYRQEENLPPN
jgi:hypothetical protein